MTIAVRTRNVHHAAEQSASPAVLTPLRSPALVVPIGAASSRTASPTAGRQAATTGSSAYRKDKLIGRRIGSYTLLRRLGSGSIGVVYEAEHVALGRRDAIKLLTTTAASDARKVKRFQREAALCGKIRHPNVVGVYDCGFEQGVHYMAMEYVDGGTLHGAMKRFGRLPWEQATRLVLQVARGVEHAHGLGIIHRDIKPANILIGRDGSAKLSDLGLAKQIEEDSLSFQPGLTMHGVVLGSPAYMSPEQIRSSKDVVPQSDIYALGATLFQMITGELPHEGSLPIEVMNAVLTKDHRPVASLIADVPAGIVAVINQALRKQPNQRPPSVSAFIVDLEDALNRPHAIPAGTRVFSAPLRRPLLPLQPPRIADPPDHHRVIGIGIVVMLVAAMGLMLASRYFH